MSTLIRVARSEGGLKPLVLLMGIAFIYGAIHAAGPGHGKVIAMSYVLSHRATIWGGLLFGISFALIHASSGVVGVLGLRYIIQRSVGETLASVTTVTQMISFGLITLLGLIILVKHGYGLIGRSAPDQEARVGTESRKGILAWAATIGLVPCPAVVLVMLFCLSMDAVVLGFLLAACISMGMAVTISLVVVTVIMGKTGILNVVSKKRAVQIEGMIGLLSGAAIFVMGALLVISTMVAVGS
jgi:ABC-type nickel/cobalt efflux system permease component RcnA